MSVTVAVDGCGVSKIFGAGTEQQVTALNDVSVSIAQNEFFTLLGPSGCGKTTLLRLIAGFELGNEQNTACAAAAHAIFRARKFRARNPARNFSDARRSSILSSGTRRRKRRPTSPCCTT